MTIEDYVELAMPDGRINDIREEAEAFLSKIGGHPTWIHDAPLIEPCKICKSTLYFLAQMDCSTSIDDRIIYIFICNSRLCCERKETVTSYVQTRPSTKKASTPEIKKPLWDSLMSEMEAATIKEEKDDFANKGKVDSNYPHVFPCTALHIVDELLAPKSTKSCEEPKIEKISPCEPGELYENSIVAGYDKAFKNFHMTVEKYPRQCIRYCPGGKPLLFAEEDIKVPSCSDCANVLCYELQLMPAILSILPSNEAKYIDHVENKGSHPLFGDGMEWGTIIVYTCTHCNTVPTQRAHCVMQIESE